MAPTRLPVPTPALVARPERLAALDAYAILDTPPEAGFEDIVYLTTQLCGVPVALVSLVAADRQWFKARVGFPLCGTDLNASVCAHALAEPDLLVIPDLTLDPRTHANPLVTGEPHIRFYAGAPLRTHDGEVLGSLCAIDTKPRPRGLTPEQADGLQALARQVMGQLELRRALSRQGEVLAAQQRELQRDRRLSALAETSVMLLDTNDPVSVLEPILRAEAGGLGFDQSYTYDLDEGGDHLTLTHGIGVDQATWDALQHVSCDVPLCGLVARNGQPLILSDLQNDPHPRFAIARDAGLSAYAGYPIIAQGVIRGVISFASRAVSVFDAEALDFFATIARFLSVARDRVERENALRTSEGRYRTVTDYIGQAVFQMDLNGTITFANPAAEAMFGWPVDELLGRNLHEVLHHSYPDGRPFPAAECHFVDGLRQGSTTRDREDTFFRKDGTPVQVLATNAPVIIAGTVVSAVLTVADITRRRHAEVRQAALLELVERLRDLTSIPEMTFVAAEIVGRTLGASRVGFGLVDAAAGAITIERDWTAPGQTSIAGRHQFSDYGDFLSGLLGGEALVVEDVTRDPRTASGVARLQSIGVASLINLPVRQRGRTVALYLAHDDKPRVWSRAEIAFVRSVADRVDVGVARVRAEEHQHLLNGELSHRLKNTLAMVQAIAAQTLRRVTEQDAVDAFGKRIQALASAHDVLFERSWSAAGIRTVIEAVLGNLGQMGRVDLDGPDVALGARTTLSLSLLLHELATNAVKYGALSNETGRIAVTWRVEAQSPSDEFVLDWREHGGPPVRTPERRGFGSRLIRTGLVGAGGVDLRYPEDGFQAEMRAALDQMQFP